MTQSVSQLGAGHDATPDAGKQGNAAQAVPLRSHPIPKLPIYLAVSVVLCALALVFSARFLDMGTWRIDPGTIVESRDVVFLLQEDQRVIVSDAKTGATLEVVAADQEGFIRGLLRATTRERMVQQAPIDAPMRIMKGERGSYVLLDLATEREFYLRAFGKDNAAEIARYINMTPQNETLGGGS